MSSVMPKGHFLPVDCHWLDAQGRYDEDAAVARVNLTNKNLYKEPAQRTFPACRLPLARCAGTL